MINTEKLTQITNELKNKFRSSLVDRAKERVTKVVQHRDDLWEVEADPKLGDKFGSYWVAFDQASHKYECDCFNTLYGESRRHRICSHIVAVIIWRRLNRREGDYTQHQKLPRITGTVTIK